MCSINSQGDCANRYCSCEYWHDTTYGSKTKYWLVYEIEPRSLCNRIIGSVINLCRKPSKYPKPLTKEERKARNARADELRQRYGLLEDLNSDLENSKIL